MWNGPPDKPTTVGSANRYQRAIQQQPNEENRVEDRNVRAINQVVPMLGDKKGKDQDKPERRPNDPNQCHNCLKTGHWAGECPEPKRPNYTRKPCIYCGENQHGSYQCKDRICKFCQKKGHWGGPTCPGSNHVTQEPTRNFNMPPTAPLPPPPKIGPTIGPVTTI